MGEVANAIGQLVDVAADTSAPRVGIANLEQSLGDTSGLEIAAEVSTGAQKRTAVLISGSGSNLQVC